jgi:hypothetical protein
MQADKARLSKACCSPAKFVTLQSAPRPAVVDCGATVEAR